MWINYDFQDTALTNTSVLPNDEGLATQVGYCINPLCIPSHTHSVSAESFVYLTLSGNHLHSCAAFTQHGKPHHLKKNAVNFSFYKDQNPKLGKHNWKWKVYLFGKTGITPGLSENDSQKSSPEDQK